MEGTERNKGKKMTLSWEEEIPIFRNPLIRKQLGIAIGIPFGILILVLSFVIGPKREFLYFLGMLGVLFSLTWLLVRFYLGGVYSVSYMVDGKGITYSTQPVQYRRNVILNILTVLLGIFSRNPTVAGAGLLAQSRQGVRISWKQVRSYQYIPSSRAMKLDLGPLQKEYIFCSLEQYEKLKETYLES